MVEMKESDSLRVTVNTWPSSLTIAGRFTRRIDIPEADGSRLASAERCEGRRYLTKYPATRQVPSLSRITVMVSLVSRFASKEESYTILMYSPSPLPSASVL